MSTHKRARFMGSIVLALSPLAAQADVFNVAWDNDLFTGQDKGYTNGVRLSYLTDSAEQDSGASGAFARSVKHGLSWLPGIGNQGDEHALTLSLRQLMVTPADITNPEPQLDDIPYAGHLSLSGTLWRWNADSITGYGAHIGIVGPDSGAESVQEWVHKVTGSERPAGWDNQLGTDIVGGVQLAHGQKLGHWGQPGQIEQRVALVGSALLSSFRTTATTGLIWHLGRNLPMNFVPDYAGASSTIALPGSFNDSGSGWSVFVGLGVDYVAYSYLEDNSDPYRFKESPVLGQIGLGATWQWDRLQAAMIFRATTGEEQRNKDNFSFGTLSLSWVL